MSLIELLERERRAIARLLGASGAALTIASVALLLAVGAALLGNARWLALPRVIPIIFWLAVVALVIAAIRAVRSHLAREATIRGVAVEVERERALRDGSLRGAVEVAGTGALGRINAEHMAQRLAGAGDTTLVPAFRRRVVRVLATGATGTVLGLAILAAATALAPDGWAALLHPVRAWRGTLLEGVRLENVPAAVLRGERLTVEALAPGRREITIAHRRTGSSWRFTDVRVRDGRATLQLDPVDADLSIVATDGRAVSDTAVVTMVERPFIGDVTIRAEFPAYLQRQPEVIPLGEPARVPQGTALGIEGQSSTELADVRLIDGDREVRLDASGRRFTARLTINSSVRYEWRATGRSGPIADVPPALDLEVMPDSAPQVDIVSPANDTTVSAGDTIAVSVLATDDHGLASVLLRSWIVSAGGQQRPLADAIHTPTGGEPHWAGEMRVVTDLLQPGQALHIVAAAIDGSPWRQRGESRALVLRLPTLSEQREAARDAADAAVERASATASAQRQLQQRTADASRQRPERGTESGGQRNMSYESSEQAKSLAQEQRQLADRMQEMQQSARQLEEQLRQAGALDSALQGRLREVQKLLEEALTPELAEQLRKLEQASQQLSQEESRKALADLAEQQRRLREQLEKSVEMLKRAALEGAMTTLRDEAKELAERERQLADSLGRKNDEATRREARELAERSRNLSADVNALEQRLRQEKAETGATRANEAERQAQQSARAMERVAQRDPESTERSNAGRDSARAGIPRTAGDSARAPEQQANQQRGQAQQGTQQQTAGRQGGTPQQGQQQAGQQQGAQQGQQQQGQQQQGQQQQGQQQQGGQRGDGQQQGTQQSGERRGDPASRDAARQAADAMEQASRELAQAREQQVSEWKQELTTELDRSIQEMIQLAREQDQLQQQARRGASPSELRPQQSTLQQGVEKSAQRLQEAGSRSSLLSQRSLRTVTDARRQVEEATRQTQTSGNPTQVANAMRDASEALNQAAASLVRDRERAETANSASGFEEMLQQLQQMAQQQQGLNAAAQSLLPTPGAQLGAEGQQTARQLGRQQREVAAKLDDMGDRDDSGRSDELAREARQIAQALEAAQLDAAVLERQQRLFRKMLDAGRLMEQDEQEDTGKREAKSWTGSETFAPQGAQTSGRSGARFQPPTWNDLRGLTPEERRLVLEYFKKINGERP